MPNLWRLWRDRCRRDNLYNKFSYWSRRVFEREGLAISLWPNNDYNEFCHKDLLLLIKKSLGDLSSKVILDLGCGTGRLSRFLSEGGARVVAIDFSSEVIDWAKAQGVPEGLVYRLQSLFDLDDVGVFDGMITCGSLAIACSDLEELADVLKRANCSLKVGADVFLAEPIHQGFLRRRLGVSEVGFMKALRDAGFDVLAIEHLYFWPSRLLVCNINCPRWLTWAIYAAGEFILKTIFRRKILGDYIVFHARKRSVL